MTDYTTWWCYNNDLLNRTMILLYSLHRLRLHFSPRLLQVVIMAIPRQITWIITSFGIYKKLTKLTTNEYTVPLCVV